VPRGASSIPSQAAGRICFARRKRARTCELRVLLPALITRGACMPSRRRSSSRMARLPRGSRRLPGIPHIAARVREGVDWPIRKGSKNSMGGLFFRVASRRRAPNEQQGPSLCYPFCNKGCIAFLITSHHITCGGLSFHVAHCSVHQAITHSKMGSSFFLARCDERVPGGKARRASLRSGGLQ
jgi:hypothetical protein